MACLARALADMATGGVAKWFHWQGGRSSRLIQHQYFLLKSPTGDGIPPLNRPFGLMMPTRIPGHEGKV